MWTLDALIPRVGSVDRSSALKALATWVDLGVLKEDTENSFRLLEVAEAAAPGAKSAASRQGQACLQVTAYFITNNVYFAVCSG